MKKSRQLLSMPVICLEKGHQVGTIKNLVIDTPQKQVAALVIEPGGLFKEQKCIPFNKINSIGPDVVTIKIGTGSDKSGSFPGLDKMLKENIQLTGTRVITESGNLLGCVDEYYIDITCGRLTGIEFTNKNSDRQEQVKNFLDADYIQTIGKEVIICSDEASGHMIKVEDDPGENIQDKLKNLKDQTSQVWNNAWQKTRSKFTGENPDSKD